MVKYVIILFIFMFSQCNTSNYKDCIVVYIIPDDGFEGELLAVNSPIFPKNNIKNDTLFVDFSSGIAEYYAPNAICKPLSQRFWAYRDERGYLQYLNKNGRLFKNPYECSEGFSYSIFHYGDLTMNKSIWSKKPNMCSFIQKDVLQNSTENSR